ncbi:MAG: TetR/AcrR family transcriptional regulator [Lachnospiraceae bacterium]|nr:TetR/AcrR family transcriptional regulator [Lachnospiraceae bacterium]
MAAYSKGNETKKRFILVTYRMLCEKDASELTVREIARESGCSAAALYKHFDGLEYLITVASVRFLDEYMLGYAELLDSDEDFLEIYIRGWELFNHYAFERPDIYYRLFWGKDNCIFSIAFQDYFELFPIRGSEKYTAYYYTLLFNDNMQERDALVLRRLENMGRMSGEDALYFSYTNPLIVKGVLEESIEYDASGRKKLETLCNQLLRKNMEKIP